MPVAELIRYFNAAGLADCRPTHDPRRVAYNSPILFGESHENRQ